MSVLIIGHEENETIATAITRARARPTPWAALQNIVDDSEKPTMWLKDRPPGVRDVKLEYPSQHLMLGTYRVAICFEEQPAGMMRHLSVSSHNKHAIPGPQVIAMVCEAFGFSGTLCKAFTDDDGHPVNAVARIWVEEFEPDHHAVNIVELVT